MGYFSWRGRYAALYLLVLLCGIRFHNVKLLRAVIYLAIPLNLSRAASGYFLLAKQKKVTRFYDLCQGPYESLRVEYSLMGVDRPSGAGNAPCQDD